VLTSGDTFQAALLLGYRVSEVKDEPKSLIDVVHFLGANSPSSGRETSNGNHPKLIAPGKGLVFEARGSWLQFDMTPQIVTG
jgi:hypothetical protein